VPPNFITIQGASAGSGAGALGFTGLLGGWRGK